MITNATFGDVHGRLGNQLFQLGLLFAIRERSGYDFFLPRDGAALWDCFDLDVPAAGPPCQRRFDEEHGSCNFDPRVFEQPDGTAFHGYFQSHRYVDECRDELARFLRFRPDHRAYGEALLFAFRRRHGRPLVSVHVRRQDYANEFEDHWGNLARDGYYHRAVEAIGEGVTYLVFSDDLAWCRASLDLGPAEFVDVDTETSLYLMSRCDVNVIANSSFSWWGAYLNPDADVYAPSRWFGPAMPPPNDRQDDVVPPGWMLIPVDWA
ncbi:MAG: alpha-1,2-fucosyltransferase [Ilumatobacteraceae bacterium]